MPDTAGGPCISIVVNENGEEEPCGRTLGSCWYGKGKTYCSKHRSAWKQSRCCDVEDEDDEPSYLTENRCLSCSALGTASRPR